MTTLADGRMTKEALDEFRKRVGMKLRIHQINELACKETIHKYTSGLGDVNPLWRDEEYAKKTKYGCIVAPPSWLYTVYPSFVQQGLPGVHAFHSGNDWEFYKPVLIGDRLKPEAVFTDFVEKPSQFAGKIIIEYQEGKYFNQRSELVAKVKTWLVRAERQAARSKGKYSEIKLPHPWKEEELRKIEDDILAEQRTGGNTLFWEDVKIGQELPQLIKGPLGLTDEIAWQVAAREPLAHGAALAEFRKHPSWAFRDPDTYALEPIAGVHWNTHAARGAGLPLPYDIGFQRNAWLLHFLTNWVGDDGWIKRCYAEYRKFVYFSDVVWFRGKVDKKYVDEKGEHCVDVTTSGVNQRGEDTIPGNATLILSSRTGGSPVTRRLPAR